MTSGYKGVGDWAWVGAEGGGLPNHCDVHLIIEKKIDC